MRPESIKQNIQFLYNELENISETYSPERRNYLLEQIDYQELQLLKIKTQENYRENEK
jgi:hypothetical protein